MMPPIPQPSAAATVAGKNLLYQSSRLASKRIARAPMPPAHAAPYSCPKDPRIAQAVPRAMPVRIMAGIRFFRVAVIVIDRFLYGIVSLSAEARFDTHEMAKKALGEESE